MENISILDKKNCTGCRMCEQICPVNAIEIIENKEGFLEPRIVEEKCINCGLCAKRCPQLNHEVNKEIEKQVVYAAKNINQKEQIKSTSGGIFSIIANYILDNNGVVFGAAFNNAFEVEHIYIINKGDLGKLKGSKYVQSNLKDTYTQAKKFLEQGKFVLYTGTPCQISGLKSFLNKEYENLYTIDLICHGVPSPQLLKKQIEYFKQKYNKEIEQIEFRNKEERNWGDYGFYIKFKDGTKMYEPSNLNPYISSFLKGDTLRNCCYNCKYANCNRIGDITLGDYWKLEKQHPEFYDTKGVSAIIVNNSKGQELIQETKSSMIMIKSTIEQVKYGNHNLNNAVRRAETRDDIYEGMNEKTFKTLIKENLHFKKTLKEKIKSMIPKKVKDMLKRYIKGMKQ